MKLTFKVNKSAECVFEFLTDMQKFAAVHPVITKIDNLGSNNYLVHETLKFGFIPCSFTYPVIINTNSENNTVNIKATVTKFTTIEMAFTIKDDLVSSVVTETINVSTFLPIKTLIKNVFQKQHQQLFKNIESL